MLPEKNDEPQNTSKKETPLKGESTSAFYQSPMTQERVREINKRRSIMGYGCPGIDYPWSWLDY